LRIVELDEESVVHQRFEAFIVLFRVLLISLGVDFLDFLLRDKVTTNREVPSVNDQVNARFVRYAIET
jgi:hypothetical protein